MARTLYIAPNKAYVENHLGRKLNPTTEAYIHDKDQIRGIGHGVTIHFLGFWQRGYAQPNLLETDARFCHYGGADIINAPWESGGNPGGTT